MHRQPDLCAVVAPQQPLESVGEFVWEIHIPGCKGEIESLRNRGIRHVVLGVVSIPNEATVAIFDETPDMYATENEEKEYDEEDDEEEVDGPGDPGL